jgi:hypothetical protein
MKKILMIGFILLASLLLLSFDTKGLSSRQRQAESGFGGIYTLSQAFDLNFLDLNDIEDINKQWNSGKLNFNTNLSFNYTAEGIMIREAYLNDYFFHSGHKEVGLESVTLSAYFGHYNDSYVFFSNSLYVVTMALWSNNIGGFTFNYFDGNQIKVYHNPLSNSLTSQNITK